MVAFTTGKFARSSVVLALEMEGRIPSITPSTGIGASRIEFEGSCIANCFAKHRQ
jgi:hypothetical protein